MFIIIKMESCQRPDLGPVYYQDQQGNIGLAIEPYAIDNGKVLYDQVRAYVVMTFPYTFFNPEETVVVNQAFYRSSGHNSREQFGPNITDEQARGTWIPTNGLVAKPGSRDRETGVISLNSSFILKKPFVDIGCPSMLLSRFHNDPQLAFISYLMGGGLWRLPEKVHELSVLFGEFNLPDLTKKYPMGCLGLTHSMVPASMYEINQYIGDAVSWNWHPVDMEFLGANNLEGIDLRDPDLWVEDRGRYFIPEHIFGYYRNIKNPSPTLTRAFSPEKIKELAIQPFIGPYKQSQWEPITEFTMKHPNL